MRVLAVVQAIRKALPEATIDFAVANMARDVVEGHEAIDNVHVWKSPKSLCKKPFAFINFLRRIRRQRYDVAFDFHAFYFTSGLVVGASRAPRRYGFPKWRCRNFSYMFTNVKVDLPGRYMNRVDEFACLVRALVPGLVPIRTPIAVTAEHRDRAEQFWRQHLDSAKRTVIIHAPVGEISKRWPSSRFAVLADRLVEEDGVNVLLTCGPGQVEHVGAVVEHMRHKPVVAPESLLLKELAALIERADLFVSVDTGPMHIANALGVPVVTLSTNTYILAHRPYWEPQRVLYHPIHKIRGLGTNLEGAKGGLEQIDVESVHRACADLLLDVNR